MTESEDILVSIITNVKNGFPSIERMFKSIESQTYGNIEYIVIDGASTDGTIDLIKKHEDIIDYWESEKDESGFEAANKGFAKAKGEVVGLVCSDDWLEPFAVERMVEVYKKNPSAKIISFGLQDYKTLDDGSLKPWRKYIDPQRGTFDLETSIYCHGANHFYHRSVIKEYGDFNYKSFPLLADREFHMRLGLDNVPVANCREVLHNFQCHADSRTTGGSIETQIVAMKEHLKIFRQFIDSANLDEKQKKILVKWYGFSVVRLVYFLIRRGRIAEAVSHVVKATSHEPLSIISNLINHHMPLEYRPIITSD